MSNQLFGFSLERAKKVPKGPSFVQKDSMDGSQPIVGGGYYGYSVDFDGTVRNDHELITRYREMVMQPECDSAVDDIVNETICGNFNDVPVELKSFVSSILKTVPMKSSVVGMLTGDYFITKLSILKVLAKVYWNYATSIPVRFAR